MEAAKQQNWDPSVQLLVAFPEVMALVTRDIRWTTDLGNAFLGQQADVMNAIQQLRSQASNSGQLRSTPQQVVQTETQNNESAIQIEPANPQVIYPPVYNPSYVWGPQVAGAYPEFSEQQGNYGSGFGSGINIGGLFSGLLGAAGTIGSGLVGSGSASAFGDGFSIGLRIVSFTAADSVEAGAECGLIIRRIGWGSRIRLDLCRRAIGAGISGGVRAPGVLVSRVHHFRVHVARAQMGVRVLMDGIGLGSIRLRRGRTGRGSQRITIEATGAVI